MGQDIVGDFQRLIELREKFETLIKQELTSNSPGRKQSIRIRLKALSDQLKSLRDRLFNKVKGTIVTVTLKIDGEEYYGKLLNWSDDDIYTFYNQFSKYLGKKIEITNISRQSTYVINKVPRNKGT